jgi:hypothetical protein
VKKYFIAVFLTVYFSSCALAWWSSYKTDQFTVLYFDGYEKQALELLSAMERNKTVPETITGNKCRNLPLVLEDFGQVSNGVTDPIHNVIHDFVYYDGAPGVENWMRNVGLHEYTHMCQLQESKGIPSFLSWFSTALRPNIFYPDWFTEGLAVYTESQYSKYEGRLNDGIFESYLAARVSGARFPSILDATYQPLEYPSGDGIYIYGSAFLNYLSKKYGQDKFAKLLDESSGSIMTYFTPFIPALGMDSFSKDVYGKNMPQLWNEWTLYELDRLSSYAQEGVRSTSVGWYTDSPVVNGNKLFYKRNYPVKTGAFRYYWFNEIVERDLNDDSEKVISSNNASYILPVRPSGNKIFFALSRDGGGYPNALERSGGLTTAVYEHNLVTGAEKEILYGDIRAFCSPDPDTVVYAVQKKLEQGCDIFKFDCRSGTKEKMFSTGLTVDEMSCGGGRIVAACHAPWEQQGIFEMDAEKKQFNKIIDTAYFESMPFLTDDGKKVFFTANYNRHYSAYCYEFDSKKTFRATENGVGMYPSYDSLKNRIYFKGLNSYGYDIYTEEYKPTEFVLPAEEPEKKPDGFDLKENEYTKGSWFDDIATMYPVQRYPAAVLDGSRAAALGLGLQGGDAIGYFTYSAECFYDINGKRPLYNMNFGTEITAPVELLVSYNDIRQYEDRSLYLNINTPLIADTPSGITGLHAGVEAGLIKGLTRMQLMPYVNSNVDYPGMDIYMSLSSPYETGRMGSDYRLGGYGDLIFSKYTGGSEIKAGIHGIYDPKITDPTAFTPIRGYGKAIESKEGISASFDFSRPVIKLRGGMWNPNIYLEDLCAGMFVDAAGGKGCGPQTSGGIEMHLETKFALIVNADMGVRFAVNKDGEFTVEPLLTVGSLF